jgi:hypothetical protein
MGYRANVITQHREYGSQTFCDYNEFIEFQGAVRDKDLEIQGDEHEEFFEVDKEELQKYVDSIPEDDEISDYPSYENKELKEYLQEAINDSKGQYVSWEWF